MRAIRWLWEGSPLVNGLILGLVLVAINFGLGVRVHPYLFVAAIAAATNRYGWTRCSCSRRRGSS